MVKRKASKFEGLLMMHLGGERQNTNFEKRKQGLMQGAIKQAAWQLYCQEILAVTKNLNLVLVGKNKLELS